MESLDLIFRLMAVSQVLAWCLYCLLFHRTRIGYLALLLGLGIAGYLVSPFPFELGGRNYFGLLGGPAGNLIPALAWLLVFRLFSDATRVPKIFYLVAASYILLLELRYSLQGSTPYGNLVFFFFPQCLKLGLIIHIVYLTLKGRQADLVESRLRLRVPTALIFSAVTATVILVEIGFGNDIPQIIRSGGAGILFLFTLIATTMSLHVHPGLMSIMGMSPKPAAEQTLPIQADPQGEISKKLQILMSEERHYANDNVTLNSLSEHLNIPAYKLRSAINQGMGFRNFNQFLNSFRIAEASKRLISDGKLPILTIALDTGFRSLSAFNKAFRDAHQMTPTGYRQRTRSLAE